MFEDLDTRLLVILGTANIPVYVMLGSVFFRDRSDFLDSLLATLRPELFSAARGTYYEDKGSAAMLLLWVLFCVGAVAGEYQAILNFFPGWVNVPTPP